VGNSGDAALAGIAQDLLTDPSPLVRAMAVWALSRLMPGTDFAVLRDRCLPLETDPAVAAEWQA
jgi:epoxyqueuosine reductase